MPCSLVIPAPGRLGKARREDVGSWRPPSPPRPPSILFPGGGVTRIWGWGPPGLLSNCGSSISMRRKGGGRRMKVGESQGLNSSQPPPWWSEQSQKQQRAGRERASTCVRAQAESREKGRSGQRMNGMKGLMNQRQCWFFFTGSFVRTFVRLECAFLGSFTSFHLYGRKADGCP